MSADLQNKLINALEFIVQLQKDELREKEEHIRDLEREVQEVRTELALEKAKKGPSINPWPSTWPLSNEPWRPYGPTWSGNPPPETYTITSLNLNEQEDTQKSTGT